MHLVYPLALVLLSVFALGTAVQATDYYVDPHGSDADPGTRSRPWQSLAKVNATQLKAGDRVMLASGATFTGHFVFSGMEAGTPDQPIVIRSTGQARATILSPGQTAISAEGGGITIQNLTLKGGADKAAKQSGLAFYTEDKGGAKHRGIRIEDVEITGFGGDGISLGAAGDAGAGYENVHISRADIHDNFGTGIITYGPVSQEKPRYAHRDFFITDCTLRHNHSGSGMVVSGVDHAVVEFCRADGNDGHGGGVGIWAYAAKDVTFRHCIASGTTVQNGGDGGGFDLDGACVGCAVESCLSYGNDGPGYMHCDYPWASPTTGNVIRGCVSVNDGRKAKGGASGFGMCVWGGGLDDCVIRDNLTVVTIDDPQARQDGLFWVAFLPESAQDLAQNHDRQHLTGCVFRGNIALVAASGVAYVTNDMPGITPANVRFEGNSFRASPGLSPPFCQGKTRFATVAEWRTATGQETPTGLKPPTALTSLRPDQAEALARITDPRSLPRNSILKALATAK